MPWKESSVMEERLGFVARLLDGEAMTDLRRFRPQRKEAMKIGALNVTTATLFQVILLMAALSRGQQNVCK